MARPTPPNLAFQQTRKPDVLRDFFVYATPSIAVAGVVGTQASNVIQVQADSDFELQKLSFFADTALAAQTASTRILPLVTLQLTDQGSGRALFSTPIAIPAIMGDGQIPYILPTSKIFSASSAIGIDLVNFSAVAYNVRIVLSGSKLFRLGTNPALGRD